MNENYNFVLSQDDVYMYMSADGKTVASLLSVGNEWNIAFIDMDYMSSLSNDIDIIKPIDPNDFIKTYIRKMK